MQKMILTLLAALCSISLVAQLKPRHHSSTNPARVVPGKLAPIPGTAAQVPAAHNPFLTGPKFKALPALFKPIGGQEPTKVYLSAETGTPYTITGVQIAEGETPSEKVAGYLSAVENVLRLQQPLQELELYRTEPDALGYTHYFLWQTWRGIEVFGAEAKLHEKEGAFYLFNGRLFPTPSLETATPLIKEHEAISIAMEELRKTESIQPLSALEKKLTGYEAPTARLVVYFTDNTPGSERLAWHVRIMPNLGSHYHCFVDALSGEQLNCYNDICRLSHHFPSENVASNHPTEWETLYTTVSLPPDGPAIATAVDLHGVTRTIHTYEQSNVFYMIDASRAMFVPAQSNIPDDGVGIILTLDALNTAPGTAGFQAAHVTSSNNAWNNPKAVSAHYNAGKAYEYYKSTFGRESINGQGGNIISLFNVADENGQSMDNAFWNGAAMFYGNGNVGFSFPLCKSLDVAAHEMTHGVVQSTAGLIYQNESGALNESFADIFGVMIDRDDWTLGEEVVNPAFFPSGALRSMSDPHNGGSSLADNGWQPAHYAERFTGSEDNGGVHTNSGIVNKAFYLFASNGSVGKDKAEQVYYRALNQYLFKSAQFVDCRIAVLQAANDLYGAAVANAAAQAFDAVGIGGGSGSNPTTDVNTNPGDDFILLTDNTFSSLYIFTPGGAAVANPLTSVAPLSRPSVTDDGSAIVYIADDNTMRAVFIDWNTGTPQEQVLSGETIWRNVAVARDGSRIAALTTEYDELLWVFDFGIQQWQSFELYNPTTGQGGPPSGNVLYADVLEWDFTGEWVMYDALNALPTTSGSIDYWDISFAKVWDNGGGFFDDGFTDKLFSLLPEDVSVGNPTFSKNSDYIIAFDYLDDFSGEHFLLGANVETGDVGEIFENNDLSWPNYSVDDQFVVMDATNMAGTPVLAFAPLASDKITAGGSPFVFIEQGRWGVWFANGSRVLVGAAEAIPTAVMEAYPNPAREVLHISFSSKNAADLQLAVFDITGRQVAAQHHSLHSGTNEIALRVADLASGLYILKVWYPEGQASLKFAKR